MIMHPSMSLMISGSISWLRSLSKDYCYFFLMAFPFIFCHYKRILMISTNVKQFWILKSSFFWYLCFYFYALSSYILGRPGNFILSNLTPNFGNNIDKSDLTLAAIFNCWDLDPYLPIFPLWSQLQTVS